jgi:opacity protein-like surface antigen
MSANTEWLSSVRGRLGFTGWFNNTMPYATGGVAWAGIEDSAQAIIVSAVIGPTISFTWAFNTTKNGWVVGGGGEWMAAPNI